MNKPKSVESYITDHLVWSDELSVLRELLLKTELVETVKWGMPVYTLNGKNVVGITGFKKFFGLWFYQGSFLSDPHKILRNAQEGKTKGMRHLNFTNGNEIKKRIISAYVKEAIENEKAGKRIKAVPRSTAIPPELKAEFAKDKSLAKAFSELTKGKQKDYIEYISTAKRDKTKMTRLEKIIPMILSGIGLNDKYK